MPSPDLCIIGGAGHVGLPLALAFCSKGLTVGVVDRNEDALAAIGRGEMPFMEIHGEEFLSDALEKDQLILTSDPSIVKETPIVIVVVGTPIDEYLNPEIRLMESCLKGLVPFMHEGQLLILRSTVYPGISEWTQKFMQKNNLGVEVAFCPERIAQGYALREVFQLPQIVSAFSDEGRQRAADLFKKLTNEIVEVEPMEAELAKLFTNSWRYLMFAAANQFYMIANDLGLDFSRIHHAITHDYGRASDLPRPGFAAGPCLFKDTMQLAAFNKNNFALGQAAMSINEGLVYYLVSRLKAQHDLSTKKVGILGMAFKAESDDPRASLSYKLKKQLSFVCEDVLTTDPYVQSDADLVPLEQVLDECDILIVGVPHKAYRELELEDKVVVDVWNVFGKGTVV
ncbi:MAG: nucleotide sugar dehydrogenase [Planctomycetota bacterium]|jgi:UDP-N-acetyl-D-mannosaminuronic acid dehydrogenase|nr:nucleotide sugar dehydrogenase [Planctomycetota bacterium]MDP7248050.1 nucleotide sugar dehydrogenase [Planctomycetota bacterium]